MRAYTPPSESHFCSVFSFRFAEAERKKRDISMFGALCFGFAFENNVRSLVSAQFQEESIFEMNTFAIRVISRRNSPETASEIT